MKRAVFAVLFVVASIACDPGPMPEVLRRDRGDRQEKIDYKKYWFPTDSARPLPLNDAVRAGNVSEVRRLLEQGAKPNARWGESGDSFALQEALELAQARNQSPEAVEVVGLLLKHGADPNAQWCLPDTRQLSEWRPMCTAERGMTPLVFATFSGYRGIVELLLAAGANPRTRDFTRRSPLDYAADEVVFEMISRALFPNVATRDQEALDWLKRAGGDSYDPARSGTPLLRALISDDAGLYVFSFDRDEDRMLRRVRILMRLGADPNERVRVRSPLALALMNHTMRVAAELLRSGANVNERWCELYRPQWVPTTSVPRHLLVFEGQPHQHPDCNTSNGITPLMWIATAGNLSEVQMLLDFKADRSLRDWAGRSAADYATTPEIRKLLQN